MLGQATHLVSLFNQISVLSQDGIALLHQLEESNNLLSQLEAFLKLVAQIAKCKHGLRVVRKQMNRLGRIRLGSLVAVNFNRGVVLKELFKQVEQ